MKPALSFKLSAVSKIFLCFVSGALLTLSFPNYNLWLLAWFGFVPLLLAIEKSSRLKAFFYSYLTGVIFWAGTIYWLIHVTLPGTILLILYLALYFAFFGLFIRHLSLNLSLSLNLLLVPSVWVLLEYIRSHLFTGFPWALLGYSQYLNLPVIQIVDITGAWGVSFLVMLVNVAIYSAVNYKLSALSRKQIILSITTVAIVLVYGIFRMYSLQLKAYSLKLKTTVIQGNIPQELKWNPQNNDYIIAKYFKLTRQAAADNPDLIIWPEAALPVILEEEPEYFGAVKGLAKDLNTPILLGAVTMRDSLYYNSAVLVSAKGELLQRYDKIHLVPFGEYIPLKEIFSFLETVVPIGDVEKGKEYAIFQNRFAVLICFEDLFPELSRAFVSKGARFLVNITNDAWYKKTSAAQQHLQASVFRAVENRKFLVRAANTGVSAFISPSGKIFSQISDSSGKNIFIDGFITQEIPASSGEKQTFYTHYGDSFLVACLILFFYGIIFRLKKSQPKP